MASGKETIVRRWLRKAFPWAYKTCPAGSFHWLRDRYCYCRVYEYSTEWHGGIYDFTTGAELIKYTDIVKVHNVILSGKSMEVLELYKSIYQALDGLQDTAKALSAHCMSLDSKLKSMLDSYTSKEYETIAKCLSVDDKPRFDLEDISYGKDREEGIQAEDAERP